MVSSNTTKLGANDNEDGGYDMCHCVCCMMCVGEIWIGNIDDDEMMMMVHVDKDKNDGACG